MKGNEPSVPALVLENISVCFGGVKALVSVSTQFSRSEIVLVVGENGSGKTTLLNAVTGLVNCTGRILLSGIDISRMKPWSRARLGLCRSFQKQRFFPRLSSCETLELSAALRRAPYSASLSSRAISIVSSLFHRVSSSSKHLRAQGSMRLREFDRFDVSGPTVVLLDEPFGGLGQQECGELAFRIRAMAALGATILIVEHRHELVLPMADSVLELSSGQLNYHGPVSDFRGRK